MQPRTDRQRMTFVLALAEVARFALRHAPALHRKGALTTGTGTGAMKEARPESESGDSRCRRGCEAGY
jgi:hypothetical protein